MNRERDHFKFTPEIAYVCFQPNQSKLEIDRFDALCGERFNRLRSQVGFTTHAKF